MPRTFSGKASVILAAVSLIINVVFLLLLAAGILEQGSVPLWAGGISGLASMGAFIAGVFGIIISKERAMLVYLGMVFLILLFGLGEFLFPH